MPPQTRRSQWKATVLRTMGLCAGTTSMGRRSKHEHFLAKFVFVIVNISCSRGLVWFNISQDNAGGWRNEEITNAIKVPNKDAILIPLWNDCYGDHLYPITVGRSWNWIYHRHLVKVVTTNQEELINRLEEPCRGAAEAMLCHYAFPGLWCGPVAITIIITTILFLHIVLFSLRLCYSLWRRCRSSPLLRGLCCSEAAG